MEEFIITKIYADANGDSHFEHLTLPLHAEGAIGYLSENFKVKNLAFRKVLPTYDFDFHTAPARQFIILLDGSIEIETSLGEKHVFVAGDILQMEDITGKGHRTKNLQAIERRSVFITLE